jgi:hypothetical protein
MEDLKKKASEKPSLRNQIEFIRGSRHRVGMMDAQIVLTQDNHDMLMAIEENLVAVKLISGDLDQ